MKTVLSESSVRAAQAAVCDNAECCDGLHFKPCTTVRNPGIVDAVAQLVEDSEQRLKHRVAFLEERVADQSKTLRQMQKGMRRSGRRIRRLRSEKEEVEGRVARLRGLAGEAEVLVEELKRIERERDRLHGLVNNPHLSNFAEAVRLEAAHQRERWGVEHDAGKEPQDWFWLVGYLGGKALRAAIDGNRDKALHHCISTAAVLANWHSHISGEHTEFRPGIGPEGDEAERGAWGMAQSMPDVDASARPSELLTCPKCGTSDVDNDPDMVTAMCMDSRCGHRWKPEEAQP